MSDEDRAASQTATVTGVCIEFSKVDVMDAMMNKMDHYADLLEKQVQERTQELEIEKMKTEQLLIRMLPV